MIDPVPVEGRRLVTASLVGTIVFVLAAVAATVASAMRPVGVAVSLALFGLGCIAFLWAYAIAVERSRTSEIGVGGLYFLAGCAPSSVRRLMMGAVAVQTVVAVATASIRPFTTVAFGILVPMYGLGMAGLWAARHGSFPTRQKLVPKKQRPR